MRTILLALALGAIGCEQPANPPAVERITVDPAAAARFKMRLGPNPAALIGAPQSTDDSVRRAVHARGGAL